MSSCRVALVNPQFRGTFDGIPMGILYLAAALEEAGHTVKIYDFSGISVSFEQAAKEILADKPQIIGITGTSPSHIEAIKLANIIRVSDPAVWLVKGGYHEKFGMWRDALSHTTDGFHLTFNFAVTTDGEAQIIEIANACAEGREVRDMSGIVKPPPAGPWPYLSYEQAPSAFTHLIPARHLLSAPQRYRYQGIFGDVKATQLMTYRGCRFQCSFCAIPNSELNHDLDVIESDIKGLAEQGYGAVFIDDGTFTVNWERARKVCDLLHKYDMTWACQTRIDVVDAERLRHMAKTGCTYVYYGLESGSPRVLSAIKKSLKLDRVAEMVGLTKKFHMRAVTSFIFGVPFENNGHDGPEDWDASVELIRRAEPNAVIPTVFAYYPGSPAWNSLPPERRDGYIKGDGRRSIWTWFDDGWGAIHAVTEQTALDIRNHLDDRIKDFLWQGLQRTA